MWVIALIGVGILWVRLQSAKGEFKSLEGSFERERAAQRELVGQLEARIRSLETWVRDLERAALSEVASVVPVSSEAPVAAPEPALESAPAALPSALWQEPVLDPGSLSATNCARVPQSQLRSRGEFTFCGAC